MSMTPVAIGTTAVVSMLTACLGFMVDTGPIDETSALMIVFGLIMTTLGGLAGLLLVRAPWSRWLLGSAVVAAALLAAVGGTAAFWISLPMATLAIIGLAGPWLTLWVRQQPAAERLGPVPVTLITSGAAAPIFVGLAAYQGVTMVHWLLVGTVLMSSWAFGRGIPLGIWGYRAILPPVALVAVSQTPQPSGVIIAVGAIALIGLAWTPRAREVTAVITPPLPAPVARKGANDATK